MSCPHSRAHGSRPETCSLCLGATPRKVVQVGAELVIDGIAVRSVELKHEQLGPMRVGPRRRARSLPQHVDADGAPIGEADE